MNRDLQPILTKIKEMYSPKWRAKVEDDLNVLKKAGIDSAAALARVINDKSYPLRIRLICCWVGGFVNTQAVAKELLKSFRHERPLLAWEAAKALAKLSDRKAITVFIRSLNYGEPLERRMAAAYALGSMRPKGAFAPLRKILSNRIEPPKLRAQVAEVLGDMMDKRAVPLLISSLRDRSTEVRFWATFSLGQIRDERALPELKRLAREDKSVLKGWWSIKKEARDAIRNMKNANKPWKLTREVTSDLIRSLRRNEYRKGRIAAARILGMHYQKRAVIPLIKVLSNRNEPSNLRAQAAESLGKLGDKRAVPLLKAALKDRNKNVRFWARSSLKKFGESKAQPRR